MAKTTSLRTLKRLINKKAMDMMRVPQNNPMLFHRHKKDLEKLIERFKQAGGNINAPLN